MSTRQPPPETWANDLTALLPAQGYWSEAEYLWLTEHSNRLVEYNDGHLEMLPMPTDRHQTIVFFLQTIFAAWLRPRRGKVLASPLRLRLTPTQYREPDILLLLAADDPRRHDRYWEGADLVLEVVSQDDRRRDLVLKRAEYAAAGIPEYWIVDPEHETVTVLRLDQNTYVEGGVYKRGEAAASVLLAGLTVDVASVFDAE
jgi:Uma2 family endonuclease